MQTRSHSQNSAFSAAFSDTNSKGIVVQEEKPHGRISLRSSADFPVAVQYTFRNVDEAERTFNKRLDQIDSYDLFRLSYHLHTC